MIAPRFVALWQETGGMMEQDEHKKLVLCAIQRPCSSTQSLIPYAAVHQMLDEKVLAALAGIIVPVD